MGTADGASQLVLAGSVDSGLDYLGGFHLERDLQGRGVHAGQIALTSHGLHEICKQRRSLWTGESCHVLPPFVKGIFLKKNVDGRKTDFWNS
jgi:hypothetical protein